MRKPVHAEETMVFSDRFWLLKVAAAVALLVWMGNLAVAQFVLLTPNSDRAAWSTRGYEGKEVRLWARLVLAHAPDGFDVSSRVGPFRIRSTERPPLGEYVSVHGRVAAVRSIEPTSIQVNRGYVWKRPLNYGLSALTVLAFLWAVRDRLRFRLHEGLFRSRY